MSLIDDWDDQPYALYAPHETTSSVYASEVGDVRAVNDDSYEDTGDGEPTSSSGAQFSLDDMRWSGREYGGIRHVAAAMDTLYVATDRGKVIRWSADSNEMRTIDIGRGRGEDSIHRLFLDPTGNHLLITLEMCETLYCHVSSLKAKALPQMKGVLAESIAWDMDSIRDTSTGDFLVGSSSGIVYKACVENGKDKSFKALFELTDGAEAPVLGLAIERFDGSGATKFFVMAATTTRYYQFVGGPTLDALFAQYVTSPQFIELPGDLAHSELRIFRRAGCRASSFVWITGPGIYSGNLVFGSQTAGDSVVSDFKLLPYPTSSAPLSLLPTEFHIILAYKEHITVLNQLTEQVVKDFNVAALAGASGSGIKRGEQLLGIAHDSETSRCWAYSSSSVWEIFISHEDEDVWKHFLELKQFDSAFSYCRSDEDRDVVQKAQADHFFSLGRYELAARVYATTSQPFEDVALKLQRAGHADALRTYLLAKLDSLKITQVTQHTMLATWLVELYLDALNKYSDRSDSDSQEVYDELLHEFQQFLRNHSEHLDKDSTYSLITSHGQSHMLLFYADLNEDFDRIISYRIQHGDWSDALDVLCSQTDPDLVYRFAPTLLRNHPVPTMNAVIRMSSLDPRRLMPALLRYKSDRASAKGKATSNQAVRYVKHCIRDLRSTDPVLHNFLVSLLASDKNEQELMSYLDSDNVEMILDLDYAIRVCRQNGCKLACVRLLALQGMYESAVEMALDMNDVALAKEHASGPDDVTEQRALWLIIAKYLVKQTPPDVQGTVELVASSGVLRIEDVLPFFPDFVVIDNFKDEICDALEDYSRQIEDLRNTMQESTKSADAIRKDIRDLRGRACYVSSNQRCDSCNLSLLSRQLYVFPCSHAFHADCLRDIVLPTLPDHIRTQVVANWGRRSGVGSAAEVEDSIASSCPLCGDIMIDSIDQPLGTQAEARAWKLPDRTIGA